MSFKAQPAQIRTGASTHTALLSAELEKASPIESGQEISPTPRSRVAGIGGNLCAELKWKRVARVS